jgi:putative endonuclease
MWLLGARGGSGDLGRRGERKARSLLRRKGLKILARNYRCPSGEIDLIALDRGTRRSLGTETLVFVEVKTRTSDRYTDPASAVNADKQRRVKKAASYYRHRRGASDLAVRFDVVSIVLPETGAMKLRHIEDAFR